MRLASEDFPPSMPTESVERILIVVRWTVTFVAVIAARAYGQAPTPVANSTYRFALCRPACGAVGSDTLGVGRIAFFAEPLDTLRLGRILAGTSDRAKEFLGWTWEAFPEFQRNACFVYDRKEHRPRSFATIRAGGLSTWKADSGPISFGLYQAPDAWHSVRVTVRDSAFVGSGVSWGAEHVEKIKEHDAIVGSRIGSADSTICVQAARALEKQVADFRAERNRAPLKAIETFTGMFRLTSVNDKLVPPAFVPGSDTALWNGWLELGDSTAAGRRFTLGLRFVPKGDTMQTQTRSGTYRRTRDSLLFTNDGQEGRPPVRFRYAWRPDSLLALTDEKGNVWVYWP